MPHPAGVPVEISKMTIKLFLLAGYWLDIFDRGGKGQIQSNAVRITEQQWIQMKDALGL